MLILKPLSHIMIMGVGKNASASPSKKFLTLEKILELPLAFLRTI